MMASQAVVDADSGPAFIQATEVWVPDPAGEKLIRVDGVYGPLKAFDSASADEGFARGKGLPGRAWAEGRPIILRDLQDDSQFRRAEAAAAAGLTAAAAVPVFSRNVLKGVLVMLCAEDATRVGAIEVWRSDDAPDGRMRLDQGFYGAAKAFQSVSESVEFQRGQGLPGGVWAARAPMLIRDLGRGYGFLRAESAGEAGLTTGLGIPVPTPSAGSYVLTLLSSRATPIARRFELWDVVSGKGGAKAVATLTDGLCDTEGPLWATERKATPWQGAVGRALATGAPVAEAGPVISGRRYAGMAALPIHAHGEVTRVVAWFF